MAGQELFDIFPELALQRGNRKSSLARKVPVQPADHAAVRVFSPSRTAKEPARLASELCQTLTSSAGTDGYGSTQREATL